ncbi:MAG: hypothetical protein IJQ55_05765 [Alphaproteobacteria bacterium]|nr:hypothetical protein [Alphaproteobacteria bacterium]
MANKNTFKRTIIWTFIFLIAALTVAILVIPPAMNLNFLKPKIENIILTETGVPAEIKGNINFSLLGRATIVANNVKIPNGTISSCEFAIPFFDIFNLENAKLSSNIVVNKASVFIEKLVPFDLDNKIIVHDSKIQFLNKEYSIIYADLSKDSVEAIVRTDQHKYEIKSHDNKFIIKNKNNDLNLSGKLLPDGGATAHIDITAQNINRWFEFSKPRITGQFPVSADVFWDGGYGVNFYNISANGISGEVTFQDNGYRIVKLKSQSADYDLSFFLKNPDILQRASFNLDFYGTLKFADKTFNHVKMITTGFNDQVEIKTIIADDLNIQGGTIDANGAHNVFVTLPENGITTTCLFNGTPKKWSCNNFSYGNKISGNMSVDEHEFNIDIYSHEPFSDIQYIVNSALSLGDNGTVNFDMPDMNGTIHIKNKKYSVLYSHLKNKSLEWAKIDLPFVPDFMKQEKGNFTWTKDSMIFTPNSGDWQLSTTKDFFIIHGDNFKKWLSDVDLQSLRDLPYSVSGNYKNGNISNLIIEIAHQRFAGTASGKSITLKTNIFNLDNFLNPYFINNFEDLAFFTNAPMMLPFDLGVNIALASNSLVYKSQTYNNFVYSLHDNVQTFSITDSSRGNILATITKNNIKYALNIQLNKFVFNEKILPTNMPLNISNTMITGDIQLNTYGKIAHDILDNLNGTFDISFYGGKIYGFGFDDFYASAPSLTILNGEYALYDALLSVITQLKKMHISGTYENGNIKTTLPLSLTMRHVDASGTLEIKNNEMFAKLNLVLRGTSASPEPIDIVIYPNDKRDFSLSEIMLHFDPEYMRSFVLSHDKF